MTQYSDSDDSSNDDSSRDAAHRGYSITENRIDERFELRHGGELVSFARFREEQRGDESVVVVPHVETVSVHRGHGHAAQLMDGVLDTLRRDGRRIVPLCSFAAAHVNGSADNRELLASR